MNKYVRLTVIEREEISRLLAAGYSLREISKIIHRSPSSISREINRSVADITFYRAVFVHQSAIKKRHNLRGCEKALKHSIFFDQVSFFVCFCAW